MHPGLFLVRRFTGADLFMRSGECCTSSRRHMETHLFMPFTGRRERGKKCCDGKTALVVFKTAIFADVTLPFSRKEKREKGRGGVHRRPGQRRRRTLAACSCSFQRQALTGSRGTVVVKYTLFVFSSHVPPRHNRRFRPTDTTII